MANGVNKVIAVGRLGRDPEHRVTKTGKSMVTFSIAVNERRKNTDGEWVDDTEWINCVAFGKTADLVQQYCRKGSNVYIEGRMATRSWEDRDSGKKMYRTEVKVQEVTFLDSKRDSDHQGGYGGGYGGPDTSGKYGDGPGDW